MNRRRAAAVIAVLAILLTGLALSAFTGSSRPGGDRDHSSDCWAHPGTDGHRHCATAGR